MPKRRSVVPGYTKRLQRSMKKFKVPTSVIPAPAVANESAPVDPAAFESLDRGDVHFTGHRMVEEPDAN